MKKGDIQPENTNPDQSVRLPQDKAARDKKWRDKVIYWALLNLGTLMMAAGVYFFKKPNRFVTGGVSGLSILLDGVAMLTQSQWMLIINIFLLIVGFFFLGKECTAKTIYCSLVYSLENMLFEYVFPLKTPMTQDPFLELVYGMMLAGAGSAIIFNCGASSGGTDIIALILKKYSHLDVGKSLLVVDFFIVVSSFFVYKNIQTGLYSMAGLFAHAFLIDGIIESIGRTKYVTIITLTPEPIREYILYTVQRSCTVQNVTGGYSGEAKTMILTICTRSQARRLKAKVKEIDPLSFIIITDTSEILGKGFRETV